LYSIFGSLHGTARQTAGVPFLYENRHPFNQPCEGSIVAKRLTAAALFAADIPFARMHPYENHLYQESQ
jgi:hypothetical protein